MNWGSLISSVLPTIGTVVGSLLGANTIEDGVVEFYHSASTNGQEGFSSTFYCENGKYNLFNQSSNKDDIVAMTFPAHGDIGDETILVPGRSEFDVTPFFQDNALHDNSQFELTACSASQQNGQSGVTISASGKQVPVTGQRQDIGTYLAVQVEPQQITVFPKNGAQLQQISMLSVQGSGDTGMRVMGATGEPQAVTVQLPEPLQENDRVCVEVVADVQQSDMLQNVKTQKYAHMLREVEEEKAVRIQDAPRLNWGKRK